VAPSKCHFAKRHFAKRHFDRHSKHSASGGVRRLVRRRRQLTRDSVEQPGEIGVGQTAARNYMTGMNDTGVIARESHPNPRK
jgi:hypothetical protein